MQEAPSQKMFRMNQMTKPLAISSKDAQSTSYNSAHKASGPFNVPVHNHNIKLSAADLTHQKRVQSALRSRPASLFHVSKGKDGRKSITAGTHTTSQTKT